MDSAIVLLRKWWRHAFFHLFENAIVNAYILYRLSVQDERKMDYKPFRIELATCKC